MGSQKLRLTESVIYAVNNVLFNSGIIKYTGSMSVQKVKLVLLSDVVLPIAFISYFHNLL